MAEHPLVVVADFLAEPTIEAEVLAEVADVRALLAVDEEQVLDLAPDAQVLLVFHLLQVTDRLLSSMAKLKGIVRCGVGFDNVDRQAAGRHGIAICNIPDYGTEEVADHALLLLLACARRLIPCHDAIRTGTWDPALANGTPRLRGRTVGVIGCGRIGTAFARRAAAVGLRVLFHDPYLPAGYDKAIGHQRTETLGELLAASDFVSVHTPLTAETRHLLNAQTLRQLPQGAMVINTARGGCIDLDALADALDEGHLGAAGLDVVDPEPLGSHRIAKHPRVVLTPHVAFYSVEGLEEMRRKAAMEAARMLLGRPVRNLVNRQWLASPRCVVPAGPPEA